MSVTDQRIADGGIGHANGLFSVLQIKSARHPGAGDRGNVCFSMPKDNRYDGMMIILVVHRYATDEERQEFEEKMNRDPFFCRISKEFGFIVFAALMTYPESACRSPKKRFDKILGSPRMLSGLRPKCLITCRTMERSRVPIR